MRRIHSWLYRAAVFATAVFAAAPSLAQVSLSGSQLALNSAGMTTLSSPGFLGTYLTVPAGGATVSFTINATEGAGSGPAPHLNLVIADSTFGFNIGSTSPSLYTTGNLELPGGTYFVRAERDYANSASSSRSFTINNLAVSTLAGNAATFSNTSTSANALAAADTYIANYRKGPATLQLVGVAPGTPVQVNLSRIGFNFGNAVPGSSSTGVSSYLGSGGTTQQTNYQSRLNLNFNALVPENAGKWSSNESTRDAHTMGGVDTILNYAQSHNMTARMHNVIWGSQQPGWVSPLLTDAGNGNATAANELRGEISERIDYYVGTGTSADRAHKIAEVDIYNESYHTGSAAAGNNNYWDIYGPAGIAGIHNEIAQTIAASGASTKLFTNEYNVLQNNNTSYGTFYAQHITQLRDAGGQVDGVGIQYYPNSASGIGSGSSQHSPARIASTLQNLSVQGVPLVLTEFGVGVGGTDATVATILGDSMRLMFGTPQATGFFLWGFHDEGGTNENLFRPAAALYQIANPTGSSPQWNNWTLTPSGQVWQDLLGIADWDGNPANAWDTNLTAIVNADGTIDFNGFYGQYTITIGGETFTLDLTKGTTLYTLLVNPVLGDFNIDGHVTNADLQAMLDALANLTMYQSAHDLTANELKAIGDLNGDQTFNAADIAGMLTLLTSGNPLLPVPEPSTAVLASLSLGLLFLQRRRVRRRP